MDEYKKKAIKITVVAGCIVVLALGMNSRYQSYDKQFKEVSSQIAQVQWENQTLYSEIEQLKTAQKENETKRAYTHKKEEENLSEIIFAIDPKQGREDLADAVRRCYLKERETNAIQHKQCGPRAINYVDEDCFEKDDDKTDYENAVLEEKCKERVGRKTDACYKKYSSFDGDKCAETHYKRAITNSKLIVKRVPFSKYF